MSSFTKKLYITESDKNPGMFRVTRGFSFYLGDKDSKRSTGMKITVPRNFETNFASVPRILWSIFPPYDPKYGKSACLHDYMYSKQMFGSQKVCDSIFLHSMRILGANSLKAWLMYKAVDLFGKKAWDACKKS